MGQHRLEHRGTGRFNHLRARRRHRRLGRLFGGQPEICLFQERGLQFLCQCGRLRPGLDPDPRQLCPDGQDRPRRVPTLSGADGKWEVHRRPGCPRHPWRGPVLRQEPHYAGGNTGMTGNGAGEAYRTRHPALSL